MAPVERAALQLGAREEVKNVTLNVRAAQGTNRERGRGGGRGQAAAQTEGKLKLTVRHGQGRTDVGKPSRGTSDLAARDASASVRVRGSQKLGTYMLVQVRRDTVLHMAHGGAICVSVVRQDKGRAGWQSHPVVRARVAVKVCHGRDRDLGIDEGVERFVFFFFFAKMEFIKAHTELND